MISVERNLSRKYGNGSMSKCKIINKTTYMKKNSIRYSI